MTNPAGPSSYFTRGAIQTTTFVLLVMLTLIATTRVTQAQTFTVLHTFTGGGDGAIPTAGLTMDRAGNLYGAAENGGINSPFGTAFKLKHTNSGWALSPLYEFSNEDGQPAFPDSPLIFGPDGNLYGSSGGGLGFGTVYKLQPPPNACKTAICYWTLTVLYQFMSGPDGHEPGGNIFFDQAGNLYGTTQLGGTFGYGTAFKLSHSGGNWTESVLYSFMGGQDGNQPLDGVVMDNAGSLYGTTRFGGTNNCTDGCGTVFELSPSGFGWTEQVIYMFQGGSNAYMPYGGVILDASGNLYGATYLGGTGGSGVVFELSPSDGGWNYKTLYNVTGDGGGPAARPTMDAAGNLYGTSTFPTTLFKLTPSDGRWTYTDLHNFGSDDGSYIKAPVLIDSQGNIYGTASQGGADEQGTAWEFAP